MRRPSPAWLPATAWTVVMLQIVIVLAPALTPTLASAQGAAPSSVDRGREYYEQSRFDEAITLLQDLVDRGALSGADLQKARELLARSLVKKGYPVRARGLFKAILVQDAAWRPDPIRVPPDEAAVFEQALKEFETERSGAAAPAPTPPVTPPAGEDTKPAPATPPTPPRTTPQPARPVPASTIVPSEKKSSKTLWWIVGGVAVAAIVGVAAAGGGGGGDGDGTPATPLPAFPAPPTP